MFGILFLVYRMDLLEREIELHTFSTIVSTLILLNLV